MSVFSPVFGWSTPAVTIGATALATYIGFVYVCRHLRYQALMSRPDPTNAHEAHPIYFSFFAYEFPFIAIKALEFGLFKTYGIPSISKILVSTGELTDRVARRYDDTDLIVRLAMENAPDSLPCNLALQRLNFLHGQYPQITNDDYLYVLSIFVVEPIRFVNRYGYRKCTQKEKDASVHKWIDIGIKMNITGIPTTFDAFERLVDNYEEKHMNYHPANREVAKSTVDLLLSILPGFLHPLGRYAVYSLCDSRLRKAMDFPSPHPLFVRLVEGLLWFSGVLQLVLLPPRVFPYLRIPQFPESLAQPARCPFTGRTSVALTPQQQQQQQQQRIGVTPSGNDAGSNSSSNGVSDHHNTQQLAAINVEKATQEILRTQLFPRYHPYEKTYDRSGFCIDELGPEEYVDGRQLAALGVKQPNSLSAEPAQ